MTETITHPEVPTPNEDRQVCLGRMDRSRTPPEFKAMLKGRRKLPILFRLLADPAMRTSRLL